MLDHKSISVAYAHDWLVGLRGGELILDRLIGNFGPGPIYTLVSNAAPLSEAIDACPVRTSFLQRFPAAAGAWRRWYFPLMPAAVDRLAVAECDLLLSTSSCVMKGIKPPPRAVHVNYNLSPARYIWAQHSNYDGGLRGFGLRCFGPLFKRWDRRTAAHVDLFIAESTYIAEQIRDCYGRDSVVVFPPVRTEFFTPDSSVAREDFWLLAAALEPFKRADLAIKAANQTGHRLIVAGSGSLDHELRAMAGPSVEFVGMLPADQLRDLYRRARLFLFPSLEDFGIAPVEAMACGCPVVALRGGGALDTVNESCGAFMETQTVDDMLRAIDQLPTEAGEACRANAERFSEAVFDEAIRKHVAEALEAGPTRPGT